MKKTKKDSHKGNADFPGYPLYPAGEDITQRGTRVETNIDETEPQKIFIEREEGQVEDDNGIVEALGPNELTQDDFEALGPKDLSMDMGDDEQLLVHRKLPVDFSGDDLDIPGSALDDAREVVGSEDEENNGYSLGGDNHDDLEEDHS